MLALSACSTLQQQGLLPVPVVEEAPISETATPTTAETQMPTLEQPSTPTPSPLPTEPPPLTLWPLDADLYYLDAAGRIWLQPLFGDESAATTVAPIDQVVLDFDVAPGWVLYRTGSFVAVTTLDGLSGQVLAFEGGQHRRSLNTHSLAWSPDAAKLAFTTAAGFQVFIPGQGADFGPLIFDIAETAPVDLSWSRDSKWLLVRRADGGAALYRVDLSVAKHVELGQIIGHAWLSDGRLAFCPAEGGLALLDPDDLNSRVFLVPQDRQVTLPGERADGLLAFFTHPAGASEPGFLHLGNPADLSFSPASAVPVRTTALIWNATATRLIGPDPSSAAALVLDPLTGSTAVMRGGGTPVAFVWDRRLPETVIGATLPSALYFLAPQAGIVQLWRLPPNGGPPQALTNATADVIDYDISSDGTQVVYTSGGIIYRAVINTLDINQVAALAEGMQGGEPSFSPNGRQIAYTDADGIWVYNLDDGQARRVSVSQRPQSDLDFRLVKVYGQPQWSPDGQWLAVRVGYYEGGDHALIALNPEGAAEPLTLELFAEQVRWIGPGRLLAYSEGGPYTQPMLTLVEITAQGQPPTITRLLDLPVVDVRPLVDGRLAVLSGSGPYAPGPRSNRLYAVRANGTGLELLAPAFVLESPILSPDASLVAGVAHIRLGNLGLAIIQPASGKLVVIDGVSRPHALRWGP